MPASPTEPDAGGSACAVLGTGLMGSAIARALLRTGARTHVWNRSPASTADLGALGAVQADTARDAAAPATTIILTVSDYEVAGRLIQECGGVIHGKTVINLVTGGRRDAEQFAGVVESLGGMYLDGAIEAYPSDIGGAAAQINFSGSADAWRAHQALLSSLAGDSRYLGGEPGAANTIDAAMAGGFYNVALGAFLEAATFAATAGVGWAEVIESIDYWVELLRDHVHESAARLRDGDFDTDQATLAVYAEAARTWRDEMAASGSPAVLMSANVANLERAVARGHGTKDICAQTLDHPRAPTAATLTNGEAPP